MTRLHARNLTPKSLFEAVRKTIGRFGTRSQDSFHRMMEPLEGRQMLTVTPDPGATFATAYNVGDLYGQQTFTDTVGPSDQSDYFKFNLVRGPHFYGRLRAYSAPADITLIQ